MLKCLDYGFVCEFKIKGHEEQVINEFKTHMIDKHGIDYSKEALQLMVLRKNQGKASKD